MKPRFLSRIVEEQFSAKKYDLDHFLRIWHYHPEVELVVVTSSTGTRFVGDSIKKFEPGDVVLIGKNLPHMWLNDKVYLTKKSALRAQGYTIHFNEDFLGNEFLNFESTGHIKILFENALRGIRFVGVEDVIVDLIERILNEGHKYKRLMLFLDILGFLADHPAKEYLASEGYQNRQHTHEVDKAQEYIFENFKGEIKLEDVAAIKGMNPSAFSRYFKRVHQKTFSRYIIDIRIGYACKLLMENDNSISNICYEAGFNNLSNFNKQFKKVKRMSPSEFVNSFKPKSKVIDV